MRRVLWIILVVAIVASLGVFVQRWSIEAPNTRVEIVYDLPGLLELRDAHGMDIDALLADLKSAGVETIAVQPKSVVEVMLAGTLLPVDIVDELPERIPDLAKYLALPVEFDPVHFELVEQAGLKVAPKLNTAPWPIEPIWVDHEPELIIVSGQGVMEREQLYGSEAILALVEFATPEIQADASTMVRLHGISAPEMRVLSDERILNRYMRAAKERNMRVLYVRPFVDGEDSWDRSLNLLHALQDRLQDAGFDLGQAQPFASWSTPWFWIALVGVGIWATTILYAIDLFPRWKSLVYGGGLLGLALSMVLLSFNSILARQGLALLAAVVFPCLAMQFKWGKGTLARYAVAAAVSLVGALFVVAMLSGTEFLVKVQEFRGVKLMHLLPIAVVVFTLIRPLGEWLKKSIPVRYLLGLGVLGLAGILYILRTGNFGLPVLSFEVQAREFLENVLVVRPRTKEFFLGHPALYFALHSKEPHKSWWLPLSVIGQISLVNTFTHTHTFLWVSLLRTAYGLVFGYFIGWLALKAFNWGKERFGRDLGLRILRIRQSR